MPNSSVLPRRKRRLRAPRRPLSWWTRLRPLLPYLVPVLIVGVGLVLLYHQVGTQALHARAARLDGGLAFTLLTVLPLAGFPVNILHVTAGIRFGFVVGLSLVALSILLQLLASFWLVRLFPHLFARPLARFRKKLPAAAHGTLCIFTLLIPGLPYFLENYTLALVGMPLRTYIFHCWPVHTLRAVLTVGLGEQSGHLSRGGLLTLAAYWLLVLAASAWTYRRLKRQLADQPAAAGDRTPRG